MKENTILDRARANRAFDDCRKALRDIGVDVCDVNDLDDIAKAIRKECVTGPNAVFNATLQAGPGVRVMPIERQGYKISANSEAVLNQDLAEDLPKGTTIQKALYRILYNRIPAAVKEAIANPFIVDIETIKVASDGIDYYDNRAFGQKGRGRKAGLHPKQWYLKIYTNSCVEPYYVCLGDVLADFRKSILYEVAHQTERQIELALQEHDRKEHGADFKPSKPHHKPHHKPCKPNMPFPDYPTDDSDCDCTERPDDWCDECDGPWDCDCENECGACPNKPNVPNNPDCGCDDDDDVRFPDDLDPDFSVKPNHKPNKPGHHHKPSKPKGPQVNIDETLFPEFGVDADLDIQFPDDLDPNFGVDSDLDINIDKDLFPEFGVDSGSGIIVDGNYFPKNVK